MPSFDIVSEIEKPELSNAIGNTIRELKTRFDFRGSIAKITEPENNSLCLIAEDEFRCNQLLDIFKAKMTQRKIDINCLRILDPVSNLAEVRLTVSIIEGIEKDLAKKIVKLIKESNLKIQCQIQKDQIRVTGKKRNELQAIIQKIKSAELGYPLQFKNFRD